MLTRIEINGFKTFDDFHVDVGPMLVILGPNASGKSNLFDAIQLLSMLAATDLRTAVKGLRGEPHELFRRRSHGSSTSKMSFAVELLLHPKASDPWGTPVEIRHSRVRYEVEIESRTGENGLQRLFVSKERATPILKKDDNWAKKTSREFREAFLRYGRKSDWLATNQEEEKPSFAIFHDGHAGRARPADAAEATVLSSMTSAEFPHLYAIREELRSWRFLQLDPAALRKPSPTTDPDLLQQDGRNLATVLARIREETRTDNCPEGVLADIAADLAGLVPGIVGLTVTEDKKNREFRVDIETSDDRSPFNARVMSDGTLRILAILTLLHDPRQRGLICFEEPENGVHPLRLKAMMTRFRELVCDRTDPEVEQEGLSQILMNSHSPVVLAGLRETGDVMFADLVTCVDPGSHVSSRRTRIRSVEGRNQGDLLPPTDDQPVTSFEVNRILSSVEHDPS